MNALYGTVSSARSALVTGITGQDGSYLAELLLGKGYVVHGIVRRTSSLDRSRINHLYSNELIYNKSLFLHYLDLSDALQIRRLIQSTGISEVYHLAGQSHVGLSFEIPEYTYRENIFSTLTLLEVIRDLELPIKFIHASSSEIFGHISESPQNESTPHNPVTPYGCSKSCATQTVQLYRAVYDLFAVNCIMYNHESPRRGENFVTRKICRAAARISKGLMSSIELGDITARRDWGHAKDYVNAMWLSAQAESSDDYVVSSGLMHSVEDILSVAFGRVSLNWRDHVHTNEKYRRSSDPSGLFGDNTKAQEVLGWRPVYNFIDIIQEMVDFELISLS